MATIELHPHPQAPSIKTIAREEFAITAKAFFAPVYGAWPVLSALLRR